MNQRFREYSDETLARLAQSGDRAAFEELCDRCLPVVYNRLRALLPPEAVEDVTQEVFAAACRSIKEYRGKSLFRTWLGAIGRHKAMDYYRRQGRQPDVVPIESSEEVAGPDEAREALEERTLVRLALQRLPAHYQEVLLLRVAESLPFGQVAEALGLTVEACKSRYRRAIVALDQELRAGRQKQAAHSQATRIRGQLGSPLKVHANAKSGR
jgi:RNA polymerase sigma-70 factor (ECF subfamily)